MQYAVEKKYLVLPVSDNATVKTIRFCDKDGNCVYALDLKIDFKTGTRDVYIDMQRFTGKTLEVSVSPQIKLELRGKDRKPIARFKEKLRPKYHFTAPEGWIGAPSSTVYSDGLYHLFYRLNPFGTFYGNIHSGYAVTNNLVDFEYRPIALFPDDSGTAFPGGAICDGKNLLGKKDGERTPIVLFYTATGSQSQISAGNTFTQCIATSTDGENFVKYEGNPIIPHIRSANRNTHVVYSDTLGFYVMSIYIDDDIYHILKSKNLTEWEKTCEITLHTDSEYSAFFPLTDENGEEKWVFADSHDRYLIGKFDGNSFIPQTKEPLKLTYTSASSRAAQKFENTGKRNIRMAWLKTDFSSFGEIYNCALSFPQEITLVTTEGGDRLCVNPVQEIKKLHRKKNKINFRGKELCQSLPYIALDISLTFSPKNAAGLEMSLFGIKLNADFGNGTLSDTSCTLDFPKSSDGKYRIRLLCDTCGIEVYLSDGRSYGFIATLPDANLDILRIFSESDFEVKGEIYKLRDSRKTDRRK